MEDENFMDGLDQPFMDGSDQPFMDDSDRNLMDRSNEFVMEGGNQTINFMGPDPDKERIYGILAKFVPYVVIPLFVLVIFIGFVGNLLVVLVVIINKNMRNTTNLLIFNLAVADILFIVFCVPFTAADYYFASVWPFGDAWCRIVQYLIIVTAFVSIYTLVFMAFDRFLAVVLPIFSKTIRTVRNTKLVIMFIWMLTTLLASPAILAHGLDSMSGPKIENQTVTDGPYSCSYLKDFQVSWSVFQILFFVFGYFLPLSLITCLYSVMLYRLLKQGPGGHSSSRDALKNKKRVVRMVVAVTAVFAVSWLPIQSILLLKSLGLYPVTIPKIIIQIASHVLAYSNSCMNPILYAWLSTSFRAGFLNLIPCAPRAVVPLHPERQERRRQPIEMNRLDIPRIPLLAEKTTADEHENHQTTNIDHPVPAIIPIDQPAIMVRQPVL